jgi:hypothetical protein
MTGLRRTIVLATLAVVSGPGACQSFVYVEPGLAGCPAAPAAVATRTVQVGVPVPGSLRVTCGFEQGSYTVTLNSTDPGAAIAPKTFLVNFGKVVGTGAFTVTFATAGVQAVSTAITSNMGSPAVRGRFASPGSEFEVVPR